MSLLLMSVFSAGYGNVGTGYISGQPVMDVRDSISIGVSGTLGNYSSLGGEIFFKTNISLFKQPTELKIGLNYRSSELELDGVSGLESRSIGVFGDLIWFPLRDVGLFTGIRWEALNLNWLSDESRQKYEQDTGRTFPVLYSGTAAFVQIGYQAIFGDVLRLRLYGQPGFQQFKAAPTDANTNQLQAPVNHYRFIYNVNLGIEFRIK